jgi:hypothetical protein
VKISNSCSGVFSDLKGAKAVGKRAIKELMKIAFRAGEVVISRRSSSLWWASTKVKIIVDCSAFTLADLDGIETVDVQQSKLMLSCDVAVEPSHSFFTPPLAELLAIAIALCDKAIPLDNRVSLRTV